MSAHPLARAVQDLAEPARRDEAMAALVAAKLEAVRYLIDGLDDEEAAIDRIALLLGALRAREALGPLFDLLEADRIGADVRAPVARALGELVDGREAFDDRAKRHLLALSRDDDDTVRAFSVKALRRVGDAESRERLSEMGDKDPSKVVQKEALEARIALKQSDAATHPDAPSEPATGESSLAELAEMVRAANEEGAHLKPLLQKLGDPRWATRNEAVSAFVELGKDALEPLTTALSSPNVYARTGAALALGKLAQPSAAGPLFICATSEARSSDERELQAIALKSLANCLTGDEEGLADGLLPLTRSPDRFVRAGALLCLGRLADRVGVRAAVIALDDRDDHVRGAAAIALSEGIRHEDDDLVLPMLAILGARPGPSSEVVEAILIALSRVQVDDDPVRVRLRHRVRRYVLGITASSRRLALSVLGRCYTEDDPPPLGLLDDVTSRLTDPDIEVRLLAASFLSSWLEPGQTGAVAQLARAIDLSLQDDAEEAHTVALVCLDALVRHDTPAARAALEHLALDQGPLQARAAELLEDFTPSTEEWQANRAPASASRTPAAPREVVGARFDDDGAHETEAADGATLKDRLLTLAAQRDAGELDDDTYRARRARVIEEL